MGIRMMCLVCILAVLMAAFLGIRAEAAENRPTVPVYPRLPKGSTARSTAPLVSAMMLVLGGLGICMLFDKKNKN